MGSCHIDRELIFEIIPVEIVSILSIDIGS